MDNNQFEFLMYRSADEDVSVNAVIQYEFEKSITGYEPELCIINLVK